jgi:hypothetical protein
MALSEDQRALLGLLLGGETYQGVAEVLGTSAEDVRSRAHDAAAALEPDEDRELPPDVVRDRLAVLDGGGPATPAAAQAPAGPGRRHLTLWLIAGGGALVLLVVLVVVAFAGGGSGGEDTSTVGGAQEDAIPVRLTPVGGSKASGGLTIVRVADQPVVDLAIRGLQPSGRGETYVLWFVGSGGRSLPVAFQVVGQNGRITGRTPIPTAAASLLPSFDTADLTLTRESTASTAVKQAAQAGTLPQRVGTSVLRGPLR